MMKRNKRGEIRDEYKQKRRNNGRMREIRVKRGKKIVGGWLKIHISTFKASARAYRT